MGVIWGVIRRYRTSDAAACCRVANAALARAGGLDESARRLIRERNTPERLGAELAGYVTLVYEEGGAVAAVAALDVDGAELKRLYIAPAAQGRGVGRALAEHLEGEARALGLTALAANVVPGAEAFYERLGYRRLGEDGRASAEAGPRLVHMRKELVPSTVE